MCPTIKSLQVMNEYYYTTNFRLFIHSFINFHEGQGYHTIGVDIT